MGKGGVVDAEKWFNVTWEAFIFRHIISIMGDDFPSVRELRIQAAKLDRMLSKPLYPDAREVIYRMLGGGHKKTRKLEGQRAARIGEQAKKLRQLMEQSFKTWLRQQNPQLTNAQFQAWKQSFYEGVKISTVGAKQRFDRQMKELAAANVKGAQPK
jgi:hypothetical protein